MPHPRKLLDADGGLLGLDLPAFGREQYCADLVEQAPEGNRALATDLSALQLLFEELPQGFDGRECVRLFRGRP